MAAKKERKISSKAEKKRETDKRTNKKINKKNTTKKKKSKDELQKEKRIKDEIAAIVFMVIGAFLILSMHTSVVGVIGKHTGDILKGIFGHGAFILAYFVFVYGFIIFIGKARPFKFRTLILMILMYFAMVMANAVRFLSSMEYGPLGMMEVYKDGVLLKNGGVFAMYSGTYLQKAIGAAGIYMTCALIIIICTLLLVNTPISAAHEEAKRKREARKEAKLRKSIEKEKLLKEKIEIKKERLEAKETLRENRRISKENRKSKALDYMGLDEKFGRDASGNDILKDENYIDSADNIIKQEKHTGTNAFEDFNMVEPAEDGFEPPWKTDDFISSRKRDKNTDFIGFKTKDDSEEIIKNELKTNRSKAGKYKLPPLSLLEPPAKSSSKNKNNRSALLDNCKMLEDTLKSFNVDAKVVNVTQGSSVTRYEIQPAVGVKVSSIVRLTDDIALNLRAGSIRMEAPIPGKAAVGIEVENSSREMVRASEIIGSREFKSAESSLSFAVGKDIGGSPVIADLGKMPHMLIAGATGSGKSVCINTIITSLLYKATPDEVKLVLIDPKMVELGSYNGIPHLLIPVVTDSSKAAAALNWAVAEMTDRYKKFAEAGVKDIKSYNKKLAREAVEEDPMPKIVIIIDELADLMMVASSQVEDAICRLAQLARAAGMHLIVATQRPSVDVITGLIKANIPTRIAFMVSSQIDSRTILDMPGAEKLVGNGDMLFKPQNLNKPIRIQGPFISEQEVHKIIEHVKEQAVPTDNDSAGEIEEKISKGITQGGSFADSEDDLLDDAVSCVINAGQASVSMLQRRFRIGYNRAARIIDSMEERGIVGPQDGSRPRTVLISMEEYLAGKED